MSHHADLHAKRATLVQMLREFDERRAIAEQWQNPPREVVAYLAGADQLDREMRDILGKVDAILAALDGGEGAGA